MNKLTKNRYDVQLRRFYYPMRLFVRFARNKWAIRILNRLEKRAKGKDVEGLDCEQRFIPGKNGGPDIRVRLYRPINNNETLPCMVHFHGGGYMMSSPEAFSGFIKSIIDARPCVVIAPDYRLSVDNPFPDGFNDCYDTVMWAKENADKLKIDASKFILAGHSAGGGLTAAVTLKARDTKDFNIAFHMPVYPMIDHRQQTVSARTMTKAPVWDTKTNKFAWELYLRNIKGEVPNYASPSLNTDFKDMPPAISFVGDLEPFKDETLNYVKALKDEGIPVDFKLFKGAFHGFEVLHKYARVSDKANRFQIKAFTEYYDTYILQQ